MKNNFTRYKLKNSKRVARDILFLHVFKQNDEELTGTANSIFLLSLALLFISILITSVLVFIPTLPISPETKNTLRELDNYGVFSTFFLILSSMITLTVKTGAFEAYRPKLLWVSYILILVSIIIILRLFISLVFGSPG